MYKEIELIIRNAEDDKKLRELLAAGWQISYQAYVEQEGEPTRAIYQLCKEIDGSTT